MMIQHTNQNETPDKANKAHGTAPSLTDTRLTRLDLMIDTYADRLNKAFVAKWLMLKAAELHPADSDLFLQSIRAVHRQMDRNEQLRAEIRDNEQMIEMLVYMLGELVQAVWNAEAICFTEDGKLMATIERSEAILKLFEAPVDEDDDEDVTEDMLLICPQCSEQVEDGKPCPRCGWSA